MTEQVDALDDLLMKFSNCVQEATDKKAKAHGDYLDAWELGKAEAKAKLSALLVEARIDELRSRLEYTSIIANTGSHLWRKEVVLAQNLIDRKAVLTHKPQGDSRG